MKVLRYIFISQVVFLSYNYVGAQQEQRAAVQPLSYTTSQESLLPVEKIQEMLQKPNFVTEIFPDDFFCLYSLLGVGKSVQYAPVFATSVFATFRQLAHGSPYFNPYVVRNLLQDLPDLLGNYLKKSSEKTSFFDSIKTNINNLMYSKFTCEYNSFKEAPEQFLQALAGDIAVIADDANLVGFQSPLVRFLELVISKTVWSPEEYKESWQFVKSTSDSLAALVDKNILTDINDFDGLTWALVQRYTVFLDMFVDSIPPDFYQEILTEIEHKDLVLFGLDDNKHNIIESKYALLSRKLFECKVRSGAIQKGIIFG